MSWARMKKNGRHALLTLCWHLEEFENLQRDCQLSPIFSHPKASNQTIIKHVFNQMLLIILP